MLLEEILGKIISKVIFLGLLAEFLGWLWLFFGRGWLVASTILPEVRLRWLKFKAILNYFIFFRWRGWYMDSGSSDRALVLAERWLAMSMHGILEIGWVSGIGILGILIVFPCTRGEITTGIGVVVRARRGFHRDVIVRRADRSRVSSWHGCWVAWLLLEIVGYTFEKKWEQ